MKYPLLLLLVCFTAFGQSVLIEPNGTNGSIVMNEGSTGITISKVDLLHINSMEPFVGIEKGHLVYNRTENATLSEGLYMWLGSKWENLAWTSILPAGSIIERETKADIPGFTYLGYIYHSERYFESLGNGFGSWSTLPSYPANGNVIGPSHVTYNGKFFVWSGQDNSYASYDNTGAFYEPNTNTWTSMSTTNAPAGRWGNITVLDETAGYMYIWGGVTSMITAGTVPVLTNTGGRHDVFLTGAGWWNSFNHGPLSERYLHTGVFLQGQNRFIVWGGKGSSQNALGDGAIYNTGSNTWTMLPTSPLAARYGHTAVWTGTEMIIYGGTNGTVNFRDGAAYNPNTNTWSLLPEFASNVRVHSHVAVWTGTEMIVHGGNSSVNGNLSTNITTHYNPSTNTWQMGLIAPGKSYGTGAFYGRKAIWTGSRMIVLGGIGEAGQGGSNVVCSYEPTSKTWFLYNNLSSTRSPAVSWLNNTLYVQSGSWTNPAGYRFNPSSGSPLPVEVFTNKFLYKYIKN